jgi:hypothetical protein
MSEKYGEAENFIVAALTVSSGEKHEDCIIVEEGSIIIATHSQVFGPASRSECERWVSENCESKKSSA